LSSRALVIVIGVVLAACGRETSDPRSPPATRDPPYIIQGALDVDGNLVRLGVSSGAFVDADSLPPDTRVVELTGSFVAPAFIDSHVHLSYYPVAADLPKGGIAGAVDLQRYRRRMAVRFCQTVTPAQHVPSS
jgi:cytosine/adenosine deaminase-related metal-dependent hydrolase